ncbi:hypothetical protein [Streptomyces antarcticus]|uniref:hypothetical protein n=1 Tax=Streptomyces antarcticus TaxID=2996458 RepID=UPI00226D640A|nr:MULTISPECIES: hypothetical protein [unclassified Streptomyces]MCY0942981.1 hypothetical protein [Streptomyces sp. H34-AA3]MCZ4083059.1 hypothetical protein [Streptomyces sp. H34-S5]
MKTRSLIAEALWRSAPEDLHPTLAPYPTAHQLTTLTHALLTTPASAAAEAADAAAPVGSADALTLADRVAAEIALGQLRLRTSGHLSRPHPAALPADGPAHGLLLRWAHPGVVAAARTASGAVLVVRGRHLPVSDGLDFSALEQATRSTQPFTLAGLAERLPDGLDADRRSALARRLYLLGAVTAA